jgi:hypothetical protein
MRFYSWNLETLLSYLTEGSRSETITFYLTSLLSGLWSGQVWFVFFPPPVEASSYITVPDPSVLKQGFCKDPSTWSVDEVIQFMKHTDPQISGPLADLFRQHVTYLLIRFSCCPNASKWPMCRPFSLILSFMDGGGTLSTDLFHLWERLICPTFRPSMID